MLINIILAGVGGQGVLTIAEILDKACLNNGLFFKQSEVHGMSQRGGAVYSHLRISDEIIYSDIIPLGKADIILATEPMESLRYIPYLKEDGCLITDTERFINIQDYPKNDEILSILSSLSNKILINATDLAKKIGNPKLSNTVLLGVLSHKIPIKERALRAALRNVFQKKGERILTLNLQSFDNGRSAVLEEISI